MEIIEFNSQKLIALMKPKICLWDTSDEHYSDRKKKILCWEEVSRQMNDEYDDLKVNQQFKYTKDLQKKWKNLRNSYAREVARRKTIKKGAEITWKTYIFYEQMSYLAKSGSNKESSFNFDDETEESEFIKVEEYDGTTKDPLTCRLIAATPTPEPSHKKIKVSSNDGNDSEIAKFLMDSISRRDLHEKTMDQDEDRHFLLSLLGDFKRVPTEKKMDVKIELMQTIRKALVASQPDEYDAP